MHASLMKHQSVDQTTQLDVSNLINILNSEVRHINNSPLNKLANIIDKAQGWKALIEQLTQPESAFNANRYTKSDVKHCLLRLSSDSIGLIEQQTASGKSPTIALLNHWSITGRRRPTIRDLLHCLQASNHHRAVEFVCQSILSVMSLDVLNSLLKELGIDIINSSCSADFRFNNHCEVDKLQYDDFNNQECLSIQASNNYEYSGLKYLKIEDKNPQSNLESVHEQDVTHYQVRYDIEPIYCFIGADKIDLDGFNCEIYDFRSIYESTNGFCHKPYNPIEQVGTKIGEGRFSTVFIASTYRESSSPRESKEVIAAKLVKNSSNNNYLHNEITIVKDLKHDNLLELLGLSYGQSFCNTLNSDAQYICLIYPFMSNGSLLDCIQLGLASENYTRLNWKERIRISVKVARAIAYLHNFDLPNSDHIVHRDIKSANILIGADLEPKLGDFSSIRKSSNKLRNDLFSESPNDTKMLDVSNSIQMTQNIIGTTVYMPPEAFRGDVSTKFDTFSYGIVLFELLSGMKPFDEQRSEDLFTYINDSLLEIDEKINENLSNVSKLDSNHEESTQILCTIPSLNLVEFESNNITVSHLEIQKRKRNEFLRKELLDYKAGQWDLDQAENLFDLAIKATESRKKIRPTITQILPKLEAILNVNQ